MLATDALAPGQAGPRERRVDAFGNRDGQTHIRVRKRPKQRFTQPVSSRRVLRGAVMGRGA